MFNSRCCLRHCRCRWFTHIVLLPTRMLKTTTPILIPTLRRPLFAVRAEATKFASTETPLSPFRLSNRLFFVGLILLLHQIHLSSPPLFPHQEKTLSRRFLFLSPFLSSGRSISSPSQNGASNIPRPSPSPPSYPYNWREVREIRQSSLGSVQCGNPVSAPLGGGYRSSSSSLVSPLSEGLLLPSEIILGCSSSEVFIFVFVYSIVSYYIIIATAVLFLVVVVSTVFIVVLYRCHFHIWSLGNFYPCHCRRQYCIYWLHIISW